MDGVRRTDDRSYGVKDLGVYVPDQEIEIEAEKQDLEEDKDSDLLIKVKITNVLVEYEKSTQPGSPSLYPVDLSYFNKRWTVTFSV